uniref:Uncharacterized protein n=1 Tax=Cryptosporidium parvum TaxID=5807 RepID=F0X5D1_CRYPV
MLETKEFELSSIRFKEQNEDKSVSFDLKSRSCFSESSSWNLFLIILAEDNPGSLSRPTRPKMLS